jgi:hypothetical protein
MEFERDRSFLGEETFATFFKFSGFSGLRDDDGFLSLTALSRGSSNSFSRSSEVTECSSSDSSSIGRSYSTSASNFLSSSLGGVISGFSSILEARVLSFGSGDDSSTGSGYLGSSTGLFDRPPNQDKIPPPFFYSDFLSAFFSYSANFICYSLSF